MLMVACVGNVGWFWGCDGEEADGDSEFGGVWVVGLSGDFGLEGCGGQR